MMSRNPLPLLAQRIFNVPLAIAPAKAEVIIAALAEKLGVAHAFRLNGDVVALQPMAFEAELEFEPKPRRPYDLIEGVAVVPIAGTLVQKSGYLGAWSGLCGYDGVRQMFLTALHDPEVDAIVLDIDSPGGEVAGCFDLADTIFAARGEKPIWAILNEIAYSAAYALASAADHITVPRTGGTGSIGVVCCHVDWSKALTSNGIAVTFIQHGALKTDGASEKPLSPEALLRFQADIDQLGDLFCQTVARNRGMAAADVLAMQAGIFLGAAGVAAGLADAVMAPDAAFRELIDTLD